MKTLNALKQNFFLSILFLFVSASSAVASGRTVNPGMVPVTPSHFTAVLNNNNRVELNWSTESETNLSYFVVERSTDGKNYSEAALVFANGQTATESIYSLADNIIKIKSAVVYYRLRVVDADGTIRLTDKCIIRTGKEGINPVVTSTRLNPVTKELAITIPANWQNKKVVYAVYDLNGQVSLTQERDNSNRTETMNINNLVPGYYIVQVTCNGETAQQKITR